MLQADASGSAASPRSGADRSIRFVPGATRRATAILRLLVEVVRDRERDLIVLDGGVENLVVEEGGRLWFEEDTGTRALCGEFSR